MERVQRQYTFEKSCLKIYKDDLFKIMEEVKPLGTDWRIESGGYRFESISDLAENCERTNDLRIAQVRSLFTMSFSRSGVYITYEDDLVSEAVMSRLRGLFQRCRSISKMLLHYKTISFLFIVSLLNLTTLLVLLPVLLVRRSLDFYFGHHRL